MKRIVALVFAVLGLGAALVVPASPASAATYNVCAYNLPAGFVKIDDYWDPTRCGNPTAIIYNVWTIESYWDKDLGTSMRVCAGQVPYGWTLTATSWDPTSCGHPTAIYGNIWTIRRLA